MSLGIGTQISYPYPPESWDDWCSYGQYQGWPFPSPSYIIVFLGRGPNAPGFCWDVYNSAYYLPTGTVLKDTTTQQLSYVDAFGNLQSTSFGFDNGQVIPSGGALNKPVAAATSGPVILASSAIPAGGISGTVSSFSGNGKGATAVILNLSSHSVAAAVSSQANGQISMVNGLSVIPTTNVLGSLTAIINALTALGSKVVDILNTIDTNMSPNPGDSKSIGIIGAGMLSTGNIPTGAFVASDSSSSQVAVFIPTSLAGGLSVGGSVQVLINS